jgi:hypothetical protein
MRVIRAGKGAPILTQEPRPLRGLLSEACVSVPLTIKRSLRERNAHNKK